MKKKMICKILESCNLFDLADNLEEFLKLVKSLRKNKNDILYELHELLFSWYFDCSVYSEDPYIIFEGNEGVRLYLKNRWQFYSSCKKNCECLSNLIIEIREKIINPQGPKIIAEEIRALMNSLEEKFLFSKKVANKKHIEIALLNHSHVCWNSFCSVSNINNHRYYRVIVMHMRTESWDSEHYTFLHELGHILHAVLTGSFELMPNGFDEIQKMMFNKRETPLNNQEMCELFADCFAIAAIFRLNLKEHDPHDKIVDRDKAIITLYIMQLIDSIKT